MPNDDKIVKGFKTDQGEAKYDYNSLANLPLTIKEIDSTLILNEGKLSVQVADEAEQDNTLPITSAAVYTQIGNIEVLLSTI